MAALFRSKWDFGKLLDRFSEALKFASGHEQDNHLPILQERD
jgi:hypothetical protein